MMSFIPILAATKADVTILDALPHLAGMLMVLVVLAVLWGVCVFTAKTLQILTHEPKAAALPVIKASVITEAPRQPPAPEGVSPEIVAVITAAVATVMVQSYRIISIKPMGTGRKRQSTHSFFSRISVNQATAMDRLRITVEGKAYDVTVEKINDDSSSNPSAPAPVVRSASPAAAPAKKAEPIPKPSATGAGKGGAPSPLAGLVQAIDAKVGATVSEGDLVLTLEAMKMYTPINAPTSGTITAIHVQVGDAVEDGQILYTIG